MWDLTVSVPDHCLSFYLVADSVKKGNFVSFIDAVFFFSSSLKISYILSIFSDSMNFSFRFFLAAFSPQL